ncbi:MAG: hypothetical protein KY455_08135 [Euryarchaeota archaeon]|nr:hypothetical protein [Euryarchaeota archaeon]
MATPPRELKFKVPSEFQRKLYGLKIVTGKNLSQLVTEAVGAYLVELEQEISLDTDMILGQLEANGQTVA